MMRVSHYYLIVPLLLTLSGCAKKFSDPQVEIASESDEYGGRSVHVFVPKDSSVEQFQRWSKEIKEYENSDKPLSIGFFPAETHSDYYTEYIAEFEENNNWLWVKGKTSIAGVKVF